MGSRRLWLLIVPSRPLNLNSRVTALLIKQALIQLFPVEDVFYVAGLRWARGLVVAIAPSTSSLFLSRIRFSNASVSLLWQIRRRSLEMYAWLFFFFCWQCVSDLFSLRLLNPFKAVRSVFYCCHSRPSLCASLRMCFHCTSVHSNRQKNVKQGESLLIKLHFNLPYNIFTSAH